MNITLRKLALLERDLIAKEESAKLEGYSTSPIDEDLKKRIVAIMDKVRVL